MISLIKNLWAIILPTRATADMVANLTDSEILHLYRPVVHSNWTALLPYNNQAVRACVTEAKFYNNQKAQRLLHAVIAHHLSSIHDHTSILTPIPLSSIRHKQRGYNQVQAIVTCDKKIQNTVQTILVREFDTKPQSQLSKQDRIKNMSGSNIFTIKGTIPDSRIIICDDVVTTGATLRAAQKVLAQSTQTAITCLAIAH